MKCTLEGHNKNFIEIIVEDYENKSADNSDDANWLKCILSACVSPFKGAFNTSITTYGIDNFLRQLEEFRSCKKSEAIYETLEGELFLKLNKSSIGSVEITGYIGSKGAKLNFTFESDLSFIEKFHTELNQLTQSFPIVVR